MEFYLFGELKEVEELTVDETRKILKQAKELKDEISKIDISTILDIFQKVSDAWLEKEYKYRKIALDFLPSRIGFSKEMIIEGINTMSSLLSKDGMQTRLLSDLEQIKYLDDWTYNHHFRG
ncbi:MAG: hypothetical protein GXP61_01485, partial [Epsilonproteobacteria bacterium]|nr:hypothetical protein [Campylobacterota bacterium]